MQVIGEIKLLLEQILHTPSPGNIGKLSNTVKNNPEEWNLLICKEKDLAELICPCVVCLLEELEEKMTVSALLELLNLFVTPPEREESQKIRRLLLRFGVSKALYKLKMSDSTKNDQRVQMCIREFKELRLDKDSVQASDMYELVSFERLEKIISELNSGEWFINETVPQGSCLHAVCKNRNDAKLLYTLLFFGVDPSLKDKANYTAEDYCRSSYSCSKLVEVFDCFSKKKIWTKEKYSLLPSGVKQEIRTLLMCLQRKKSEASFNAPKPILQFMISFLVIGHFEDNRKKNLLALL